MTDKTFDELRKQVRNDTELHIFREDENGEQLIVVYSREDYTFSRGLVEGDRIISIEVAEHGAPDGYDEWFPIAANEWIEAYDYGPNEVEWSALSIDEAIALAKCAYEHEQYDEQPAVTEDQ